MGASPRFTYGRQSYVAARLAGRFIPYFVHQQVDKPMVTRGAGRVMRPATGVLIGSCASLPDLGGRECSVLMKTTVKPAPKIHWGLLSVTFCCGPHLKNTYLYQRFRHDTMRSPVIDICKAASKYYKIEPHLRRSQCDRNPKTHLE